MKTKTHPLKTALARALALFLSFMLAFEPALAGTVTISSSPLATAGADAVLPNLMFILDGSGSMDSDYNGDYVNDSSKCMIRSDGSTGCARGDAPYEAGGSKGFNGVGYDPMINYRHGVKADGSNYLSSISLTAVPDDAYGAQKTTSTDVTSALIDMRYCNNNNLCRRQGADTAGALVSGVDEQGHTMGAGRFPYRAVATNATNVIFGLPEMMSLGTFSQSGTTVTATTILPHGLTTADFVYVLTVGSNTNMNVTCAAVASATTNGFTYTTGSNTTSARMARFRKCPSASFIRNVAGAGGYIGSPTSLVRVTSTAHGLQTGDQITMAGLPTGVGLNQADAPITVVDADTFTYDSNNSTTQAAVTARWVRANGGLYNHQATAPSTATAYTITPIEYCTDKNLTNCEEVLPGGTPSSGFPEPAYVRFCQTQEQATTPVLISDSSGTPRCRSKFVGSGTTKWIWPRFGWFNRDTITATTGTYTRSAARTDCAAAPTCTYAEEIANYARWWTYYRTRMQMMKTAAGRAFLPFISKPTASPAIPNKLRVGFINLEPKYPRSSGTEGTDVVISKSTDTPAYSGNYLSIAPFNGTQAAAWYATFYNQIPNQSTPLREALARVGWIYSGKLNTSLTKGIPVTDDPIEQACQRNYTILTTDGYWNGADGRDLTGAEIGNMDGNDPTTDNPYTQVVVDRTSTNNFDGGYPQIIQTDTVTSITEQVACYANNQTTFNGGTQTSCGCGNGMSPAQHRIRQRVTNTTRRVVTSNGTVTSDTTLPDDYVQSTVTGCTQAYQVTTVTPQTTLQQTVCSGNATGSASFSQGTSTTCGCSATNPITRRIKQQTRTRNHTVITTDGAVTTDTLPTTWNDTFQNMAANGTTSCQSLVVTTVTPRRETYQQLCQGNNALTWPVNAANGNSTTSACQCPGGSTRKMIIQRTVDYTNTLVTNDGVQTSNTFSPSGTSTPSSFGPAVACNALTITTTTNLQDRQQRLCQGTTAVTWNAAGNGTNPAQSCLCANPNAKTVLERRVDFVNTLTTEDGTTTVNSNSTPGSLSAAAMVPCNFRQTHQDRTNVQTLETKVCGPLVGVSSVTFTSGQTVSCTCNANRNVRIRETLNGTTIRSFFADGNPLLPASAATALVFPPGTRTIEYATTGGFSTTPITGSGCTTSALSASVFTPQPGGNNQTPVTDGGTTITNASVTPNAPINAIVALSSSGPITQPGSFTVTAAMVQGTNPLISPNGTQTVTPVGYMVTSADFTIGTGTPPNGGPVGPTDGTPGVTTAGTAFTAADFINPNPSLPTVGTPVATTTAEGSANTLADVALYYYRSDLRGGKDPRGATTGPALNAVGTDVSANVVPAKAGAKDFVTHQHMVTFTVGLADGLMLYRSDYETASDGDYKNIKSGANDACFWVSGKCNWPLPVENDASALDDLWHAAVNGRGQFYLAANAEALASGIQTALTAVNAQVAAAAASATSSPNVTQTDNQIFSTTYETNTWSGKVFAQTIDEKTGDVNPTIQWQADGQLLSKVAASSDSRRLFTFDGTASDKVKDFTWSLLTSSEKLFFTDKCVPASTLTQCTGLNATQLGIANNGSALVGFLRGQLGNEGTVFRDRTYIDLANNSAVVQTVLGDTISAKPAFLRNPTFNYADVGVEIGYATFRSSNAGRSPRVYVGANDGYLHAFNANTGAEEWAYLPRFLMPGLYLLADTAYATLHRYYADGSPETADVFDPATTGGGWKTILVAGVAGGGRGYYALDVSDPNNPKGLWEFCTDSSLCAIHDDDLGLTYGNPVIGKRNSDGRWVVVLTSGLNNISPGSTGIGHFYVLDAITGEILNKVSTGAGSFATPSGLMKASGFFESAATSATFQYVYGGDQLGNVWRLDLSTDPATVQLMTTLLDTAGRAQPITTRPALTHIGTTRILYIGTGRYLGNPDLADPGAASGIAWQQTLYGFKDKDTPYGSPSLRASGNLVQQTLTSISPTTRGVSSNAVDWNTKDGWYVDFNPSFSGTANSPGEGVNLVDPKLALGTLVVTTNVPATGGSSCSVGGSSFDYNFDFRTGQAVSTSQGGVVGRSLGGTITVGVAIVQLPSGAIKSISTGADTSKTTSSVQTSTAGASVKRFSYRVR